MYVLYTAGQCSIYVYAVDAAYEGVKKRTFLPMLLIAGVHLPFLIGVIAMYKKLGTKPANSAFKEVKLADRKDDLDVGNSTESDDDVNSDSGLISSVQHRPATYSCN